MTKSVKGGADLILFSSPQPMGILHVQCRLWIVPGPLLCLLSDDVVRDLASWCVSFERAPPSNPSPHLLRTIVYSGFEGTFFSLFGLTNRASSIIGPNVLSASKFRHVSMF